MIRPDIAIMIAPFDPDDEARRLREVAPGAGAVVTFAGLVRDEGDASLRLILEHCPGLTEREIEKAASAACQRWSLLALVIRHRVGALKAPEPIVFVGAAAAHRRAAFEATDFMMDYLKSAAPFWKLERTDRSARWIEPCADDYRDRERWAALE